MKKELHGFLPVSISMHAGVSVPILTMSRLAALCAAEAPLKSTKVTH